MAISVKEVCIIKIIIRIILSTITNQLYKLCQSLTMQRQIIALITKLIFMGNIIIKS